MREFADVCAGELRIGATVTIGTYALPDLIARFRTAFPKIMLHVDVQNTATIARAVAEGRVSLALVEGPLDDENLEIRSYADDELVPIVPLTHPFAKKRRRVSVRDLAPEPFIFREQGSGTRVQVEEALRACGVTPNVVLTLPTGEGIVRAVELGIGVSIVSTLIADGAVRGGRIARVKLHDLELLRTFRVVRLRRQTPSPAARAFTALLPSAGA
jgi:DNA-binding transcriptional LysR family regulator